MKLDIREKEVTNLFWKLATTAAIFSAVMILAKIGGGVPINVTQVSTEKKSTFDVVGEGEAMVVPDEARISFGVEETASSVEAAQEKVDLKMKALQDSLESLKIKKEDTQTTSYNVYPDYDYSQNRSKVVGYRVSSQVEVRFKDFGIVNEAIAKAGEIGLNQVGSLSFGLSQESEDKALSKAREKAVTSAKLKAKELAQLAGVNLGKVINVSEQVQGNYQPRPMLMMAEKAVGGEDQATTPSIEPGSEKVVVNVTLSYSTD